MKKAIVVIFVILLLMYHGCVIKTERIFDGRIQRQLQDGKISQQEYERLKKENNYFNSFFNFSEVLKAAD